MGKKLKINNSYSARLLLNRTQRKKLLIFITIILYLIIIFPKKAIISIFFASNLFFLGSFISKFLLFAICFILKIKKVKTDYIYLSDENLPVYSLLIPLYQEDSIIDNLISSLKDIDYPINRLDIKLIIEEDDIVTFNKIMSLKLENHYHIIKVPYSIPRTKAKACNHALQSVKGKYLAIYDAEDTPDPGQLRKVVARFDILPKEVICIQAKLNFYNKHENILTKLFSIEYLTWFEFILPALEFLKIPIPLGGSSNHFITEKLVELQGWDPYNVTEDAELGIRLYRMGYKTSLIDSTTMEEAPIYANTWFRQRARWIKGYIQTYIVHMRDSVELYKSLGFTGFIGMQFFIGVFTISFILAPIATTCWLIFMLSDNFNVIPPIISWLWKMNLAVIIINILKFKLVIEISNIKIKFINVTLYPFYFLMISMASFRSMIQLIYKPYHWDKTAHGLTKYKKIHENKK